MSGLSPELKALQARDNELERLEQQRRPRRGSLAAKLVQAQRKADKALRAAERQVEQVRYARSLLRAAPKLTWDEIKALVKKRQRGR